MDISAGVDDFGRLICTVYSEEPPAVVTSSDAEQARTGLLEAISDVEETGYGECLWREATGEYRWMFRRDGDRLAVVALWSSGTLTGWQHVLHTDTDFAEFVSRARAAFVSPASA